MTIARQLGVSTYDASYLEVASRLGMALVTSDRRLATAATAAELTVIDPASGN
jgi:predicted nucleic acid-binding protein